MAPPKNEKQPTQEQLDQMSPEERERYFSDQFAQEDATKNSNETENTAPQSFKKYYQDIIAKERNGRDNKKSPPF